MDDVAITINKDILIVAIFHLQHIASQRVSCQTYTERVLSSLESFTFRVTTSELIDEELVQR